ncbi:MAG: helix-turn-helix transcriptional regulator [Clostridia bacterium]|nr:helix-turn-helix transcriptional regulator [Clostridia bacterium]MBR0445443.1 helix-turn-helix transcriptional regulator [Clostridia bacterium]
MDFQGLLDLRQISKKQLSKLSGVPKSTIMDICAGRSDVARCSAKTVHQLAKALNCTMEEIMELSILYDTKTGLPKDRSYLEQALPPFLTESIEAMKSAWEKLDRGEEYLRWDCDYCNLQADINSAEVNLVITSEQAWYLREKYLRIERPRTM